MNEEGKKTHGKKTRAGKLLSGCLKMIAEEVTEFDTTSDRMISKAEALSRIIWRDALGYEEIDKSGITHIHRPDKACIGIVFDRIEGRAQTAISEGDGKLTAADKVSEQGKKRINDITDASNQTDGS